VSESHCLCCSLSVTRAITESAREPRTWRQAPRGTWPPGSRRPLERACALPDVDRSSRGGGAIGASVRGGRPLSGDEVCRSRVALPALQVALARVVRLFTERSGRAEADGGRGERADGGGQAEDSRRGAGAAWREEAARARGDAQTAARHLTVAAARLRPNVGCLVVRVQGTRAARAMCRKPPRAIELGLGREWGWGRAVAEGAVGGGRARPRARLSGCSRARLAVRA
jgi:hypothetical protein